MSFDAIAGQDRAIAALRRALRSGRTAHAYVFAGPAGVGKMTTALEFAKALACQTHSGDACDQCAHCRKIDRGVHPDVYRVEPQGAGRLIPIGVFRDRDTGEGLLKDLSLKPNEADRKVVLIDDAHTMNFDAQNCVLKTLEEPDEHSIFLLVTARPDALLETILSRCQIIRFAPLPPEVIRTKLVEEHRVEPDMAAFLARSSGGSLGRALQIAGGTDLPKHRTDLLALLTSLQESNLVQSAAQFVAIARELSDSVPGAETVLAELRTSTEWLLDLAELFYRDVALQQLGLPEDRLTNMDVRELIDSETRINHRAIRVILDTIEEAKSYVRSNVDIDLTVLDTFSRIAACRALRAA